MALQYDLTSIDILKILGFTEQNKKEALDELEKKLGIKFPKYLYDFLSLALGNPLFETADIWTKPDRFMFLYEHIEECIEYMKEDWKDCPEKYADNEVYQFAQLPKEQWSKRVSNYLKIGSDYSAGVVDFGILKEDLIKDNPPVYMLFEDTFTEWKLISDSLSDFIMQALVDVLACVEYNTAERVLVAKGWGYYECDEEESEIDLSLLHKYSSLYHEDESYGCIYDDKEEVLIFIGGNDDEDMSFDLIKEE